MVTTPRGLKSSVALLMLCIPLSMAQAALMTRAPWWKLPYDRIGLSAVPAAITWFLIAVLLARGLKLGLFFFSTAGAVWILTALIAVVRLHSVPLAFFAIFIAVFLTLDGFWIRTELERSFFDPKMRWFEGLPRPIPALECKMRIGEGDTQEVTSLRVSRLDREGAFLFIDDRARRPLWLAPQELVFSFRDHQVRCPAIPVRAFRREEGYQGVGFQFDAMSPDIRKNLGDFIEALRGEGYVS